MPDIFFKEISKKYGSFYACKKISLEIKSSEIHALVGENGAGKSTLMNILGGLVTPTSGTMTLDQSDYSPVSALDAYHHKIAFIHQHFVLAQQLTAFENILLSSSARFSSLRFLPLDEVRKKTEEFLKKFNWFIHLDEKVENISVGEQQRLEIIKALLQNPEIFIFDEPTAVLTPQESTELLQFLLELKKQNKTIILISHKLNEIKKVADKVTIMRAGEIIATAPCQDFTIDQIAELMIGRKFQDVFQSPLSSDENIKLKKEILIQLKNLTLYKSEIFAVAGIEGNGQADLIEALLLEAQNQQLSVGDITEDRLRLSLFQKMNLIDHVILKNKKKLFFYGFLQNQQALQLTQNIIQEWDVRPGIPRQNLEELSGGNQQKFIVGREMQNNPDLLIAAHPTRGVDLGAQALIHQSLKKFSQRNKTVFLVSSDLDEILKICDRYIILYKKNIFGPFLKNQLSETEIGQYMAGALK